MKHECPQMKRAKDINTIEGMAAYAIYSNWMKLQKRKVPTIETFSTSRYFTSFVRFFHHAKRLNLPSTDSFVKLMVQNTISPMLWSRDEFYSMYLEWIDRKQDPIDQAAITVETIYKIAEAAELPVNKIFSVLEPNEVVHLIRQRQLSPWLLLCSKTFKEFLVGVSDIDRENLFNVIGYAYWADKFEANPTIVQNMKLIATELGI